MAGFISLPVALTFVSASDLPHSVSMAGGLGRKPCGEAFLRERQGKEWSCGSQPRDKLVYP